MNRDKSEAVTAKARFLFHYQANLVQYKMDKFNCHANVFLSVIKANFAHWFNYQFHVVDNDIHFAIECKFGLACDVVKTRDGYAQLHTARWKFSSFRAVRDILLLIDLWKVEQSSNSKCIILCFVLRIRASRKKMFLSACSWANRNRYSNCNRNSMMFRFLPARWLRIQHRNSICNQLEIGWQLKASRRIWLVRNQPAEPRLTSTVKTFSNSSTHRLDN